MSRHIRGVLRRPEVVIVAVVAYAIGASFTHPFTVAADIVTALPLAAAVVVALRAISRGRSAHRVPASVDGQERAVPGRWWTVWLLLLAAVAAWELFCYSSLPRQQHPTMSSLIDMLDAHPVGKTVAFALWLALGWFLAAR